MDFQFLSLQDFLNMSGHGPYVWACYIIGLIVVAALLISPVRQKKALLMQLKQQHAQQNKSRRPDAKA